MNVVPPQMAFAGTADPFAQAKQYLARVVPWPNAGEAPEYVNVVNSFQGQNDLAWSGRAVTSLDDAIDYVQWAFGKQGTVGIYACMSTQREPGEAKVNSAGLSYCKAKRHTPSRFKSLWLDIDTKVTHPDAEYKDLPEAAAALTAFWKTVGLPKPNIIVCTGGGLQPYWCMSRALTVNEWKPLAHALVEATKRHGLKCDTGCTTDSVRVMRMPGTENRKVNPPLKARIVGTPVDGDHSVEDLWQSLEPYKAATATAASAASFFDDPALFAAGPSKLFAGTKVTNDLGEGVEQHTLAPAKLDDVAAECPFVCEAINTGGGSYANPLWNLTTLLATFTEGGRADAHRMANKHPGYSKGSTDALFDRKEREKAEKGIGWPSCKAISGSGCTACQACPNFAAGKSPFHFVSQAVPPAQPTAPAHVASVTTASNSSSDPLRFTSLSEHQAVPRINREYFVLRNSGKIYREGADGEINAVPRQDFKTALGGRWIERQDAKGQTKRYPAADKWLESPNRREYTGLQYCPNNIGLMPGQKNLWARWGNVTPSPGDCSLILFHILHIIAGGIVAKSEFLLNWLADILQNPTRKPGVCVAFRGRQGCGKTVVGSVMRTRTDNERQGPNTGPVQLVGRKQDFADRRGDGLRR